LLVSIDYAVIALPFTRTGFTRTVRERRTRCERCRVWSDRMNTYATTGCCIATLPTMRDSSPRQPVPDVATATCGICRAV